MTKDCRRGGTKLLCCLAIGLAASAAGAAYAQARPITIYRGTVGSAPVELLLAHDWQQDGLGGFLVEGATRTPIDLEKTPFRDGDAPMINVLDDPALPGSTLVLEPMTHPSPQRLRGQQVNLRTRVAEPVALERVVRFSSDVRATYDGELLQPLADGPWEFRVHARKAAGEHAGRVDRISVAERASGDPLQVIDGLDVRFDGLETLGFGFFDDDDRIDFHVSAVVPPVTASAAPGMARHYYLYDAASGGYRRHAGLEGLARDGYVVFERKGWFVFRPDAGVDYHAGTEEKHRYRLVSSQRMELREVFEVAF
jgi:hypothetical protein